MKKLLTISIVLLLLLSITNVVKAATKEQFIDYVTKEVTLNGKQVSLFTKAQKVKLEQYLKQNDLSEDTLNYLEGKFDEGVKILKEAGVTSYKELKGAKRQELTSLVNDVSKTTKIKININSNGTVDVYNLDGTKFTTEDLDMIKKTGATNYIYIPVIASIAVAVAVVAGKTLKYAK